MIKFYSDLDLISPGYYGFRPLLDFAETCYAKSFPILDPEASSLIHDQEFLDRIDSVSRCKVPDILKKSICMIIENYYFDKLTLNLDVSAISNLPSNLVSTFSKLMQHVSTNDSRIKNLVLDIMKVITEFSEDDDSIALTIILRINLLVSILSLLKVLVVLMVKCHSKSLLQKLIRSVLQNCLVVIKHDIMRAFNALWSLDGRSLYLVNQAFISTSQKERCSCNRRL